MRKQTQSKEKKQHLANPTNGSKPMDSKTKTKTKKKKKTNKPTKTQYTRPLIYQVKQKLKSETEKPNLKKKTSSVINDQSTTPPPQTRATELIRHHQSPHRSDV